MIFFCLISFLLFFSRDFFYSEFFFLSRFVFRSKKRFCKDYMFLYFTINLFLYFFFFFLQAELSFYCLFIMCHGGGDAQAAGSHGLPVRIGY